MAAVVPVVIHIPAVPANPASPIHVDANDPVVGSLAFLEWQPSAPIGGTPMVTLTNSEAVAAFASKCKLDRSPAAMHLYKYFCSTTAVLRGGRARLDGRAA